MKLIDVELHAEISVWSLLALSTEGTPMGSLTARIPYRKTADDVVQRDDAATISFLFVSPPYRGQNPNVADNLIQRMVARTYPRTLYGSGHASEAGAKVLRRNGIDFDPEGDRALLEETDAELRGNTDFTRVIAAWNAISTTN